MADALEKCPLCGWDARVVHGDADWVKCELCGEFKIVRTLLAALGTPEVNELLPYLRAHTRQASERGEIVTLHTMNWQDFALSHKATPFSRKVQKLLELVASRCEPGTRAEVHIHADAPLIDANSDELLLMSLNQTVFVVCDCMEHCHRLGDVVAWPENGSADQIVSSTTPAPDDLSAV